ncbi:hypothetical protein BKK81_33830 (plasmid) [Cupriavidus sp. USMAHM13]|nr:hypothetical protein BKK81_33830 [Cupriavidus sp. USMAHM13]
MSLPDQDHFDIKRHRLWLKLLHAIQSDHISKRFGANFAGAQGPFESFPSLRPTQYVQRIEQQEAPICAVQRASLDQHEIAEHGPHMNTMIDASYQVAKSGVTFLNNWSRAARWILNEQIDHKSLY